MVCYNDQMITYHPRYINETEIACGLENEKRSRFDESIKSKLGLTISNNIISSDSGDFFFFDESDNLHHTPYTDKDGNEEPSMSKSDGIVVCEM